ncbi:hypothetical protein FKP32DRAFT_1009356 [Trametes sanguinea]|nr:hypothetical protein FKP32DRAFT_1009356 [Trametes sanguinea]
MLTSTSRAQHESLSRRKKAAPTVAVPTSQHISILLTSDKSQAWLGKTPYLPVFGRGLPELRRFSLVTGSCTYHRRTRIPCSTRPQSAYMWNSRTPTFPGLKPNLNHPLSPPDPAI